MGSENYLVTPHFSFFEITRTDNRHLQTINRMVPASLIPAGHALCLMMERVRDGLGAAVGLSTGSPVVVHSGYRCPELNAAIGSHSGSQHLKFQAMDFHVIGWNLVDAFDWIRKKSGIKFGQIILEGSGQPEWIHLSLGLPWRKANNQQALIWQGGPHYLPAPD